MTDLDSLREALLTAPGAANLARDAFMVLPGHVPPWQSTGLRITAGQQYSLFAEGRLQWSQRTPARHGGPRFHLWARVAPGGRTVNLAADSGTFTAEVSGTLELGLYMGVWADDYGTLATSRALYSRLGGALRCLVLVWPRAATDALDRLASLAPHRLLEIERQRLAHPVRPPAGWAYLAETGAAEIFTDRARGGRREILLEAHDDQGIIAHEVDFPLTPETRLHWRWRPESLPSACAEDTVHTHDYFSLAAEFDNGRDLSFIWSSVLPPGTHFQCPVPAWSARETHLVVRRGMPQGGRWQRETRQLFDDVRATMGPPPTRITRLWLIGLATFQHGHARARFADIRLTQGSRSQRVL